MNNNLAVFAHYDSENQIADYVVYYLQQLAQVTSKIIFVSTSKLDSKERAKIEPFSVQVILRANVGHDFYSYKVGLSAIDNYKNIDNLILCNDSCYGPLTALSDIFAKDEFIHADFWGISANLRPKRHLQSYFLVFKPCVFNSILFHQFWDDIIVLTDKNQIVKNYEVGLSQKLIKGGFKMTSLIPENYQISFLKFIMRKLKIWWYERQYSESRYSWKNIMETLTRTDKTISLFDHSLVNYKLPFIKRSLFHDHWLTSSMIINIIKKHSNYSTELISKGEHG